MFDPSIQTAEFAISHHGGSAVKTNGSIAMLIGVAALSLIGGCDTKNVSEQERRTRRDLYDIADVVAVISRLEGKDPPLSMRELIPWIVSEYPTYEFTCVIDQKEGIAYDQWNQPMFAISMDGRLHALASSGENRLREDGDGDDIVVSVDWHTMQKDEPTFGSGKPH